MTDPATTRWEATRRRGETSYPEHFAQLVADGEDVAGEARLADALLPRSGTVLDVGSGMGRVSAELQDRGHRVTAVEPDADLVAQSLRTYPDLAVLGCDILAFDPDEHGAPDAYDLVVAVGNVLVYLAPDTERAVLGRLRGLLAPGGRILVGFHPVAARAGARDYPDAEFVADVEAARLVVQNRFGSYELHPPTPDYAVWVLAASG